VPLEDKLSSWTGPSSTTEQEKQERTERMLREAVDAHPAFENCRLSVYAKGSYANNTNVRSDSDVDIAVQCREVMYWEEATDGAHLTSSAYTGIWTPEKLRSEIAAALEKKFPGQVDTSGSTAFRINSNSARVEADVVPCFDFRYYFSPTNYHEGTRVFKKDRTPIKNYPKQQLENGRAKNTRTGLNYKKAVRIMKRVENAMVLEGTHREVPSFLVECLAYNCPDVTFKETTWTDIIRGLIVHVWTALEGPEPASTTTSDRWTEVNECKYLFHDSQSWTRSDGRDFAKAAWNYLGYSQ